MRKGKIRAITASIKDMSCGLLMVLFISLPVWVLTLAWRGPLFAIGALVVLFTLVIGVAFLNRLLERE